MIKKIANINNIFSFSFFEWDKINPMKGNNPNDPIEVFKENNIIFGENTNGKSNLIKIFKSLNGQDINLEQNWDFPSEKQQIELILDNDSKITFVDSKWSSSIFKDKFLIFDKYFIDKYVHSPGPDSTDTSQRRQERGKTIIYLGNFAEYNKEINNVNELKNAILEKNKIYSEKEKAKIESIIDTQNITIGEVKENKKEIQKLIKEDNLQTKKKQLEQRHNELEKIKNTLKQKNNIEQLSLLNEVDAVFSLKTEVLEQGKKKEVEINPQQLFSFTITQGLQGTLHKIAHKKDFVKAGLSLLDDSLNTCPFCEQKIKNGDYIQIIKDYQRIFDRLFTEEEQRTKGLLSKYREILEEIRDVQTPAANKSRLEKIKQFISADKELPDIVISRDDKNIIKNELNLILEKEKNILEKKEHSQIEQINTIIGTTNKLIKEYNESVRKINKKLNQIKKDVKEGKMEVQEDEKQKGISKLEKEVFFIENKNSIENYFKFINNYDKNEKVIEFLERIYQLLKDRIIEQFNNFVLDYFSLIKGFVKEISPSMDVFEIKGAPRYDRRAQEPAQCGFNIKYNGKDCRENLSEGERQVIALSFFFAQLKKENSKKKIVILDDPITSFDAGKRKSSAEVIQKETNGFEQLFIFTCDPLFREFCLKQFKNHNFYYIFKTKGSSSIHYVPKNREIIYKSFEADFKNITDFNGSNENVVIFGQMLRFCLETKIKEDYFGYSQDNLSNMIEQVAGKGKPKFEKLIDNKDIILQIYKYCNTGGLAHYPKDGSTSWNELRDEIKQYLNLDL
ncbi:MAG TPA: AAA family ATPase [Candidatus Paceibacterota bacterium]|nr:AAA family ATPase [Candidatus Paceibacterota bacterium]